MSILSNKIETALLNAFENENDAHKIISYLNKYNYYEAHCHSHDNWRGGLAQHSWRTYQCALQILRDKIAILPSFAAAVSKSDLAIVCLLHDICDTYYNIPNHDWDRGNKSHHGGRSTAIIEKFIGVELSLPQKYAIADHQHGYVRHNDLTPEMENCFKDLLEIQQDADHKACGIAWNSTRYKHGRTQRSGSRSTNLRPVAMDRTVQMLDKKMYVDCRYDFHVCTCYGSDSIQTDMTIQSLGFDENAKIPCAPNVDVITAAHEYYIDTSEKLCLVLPADRYCPSGCVRSPWRSVHQKDLFICSNIALAFFKYTRVSGFEFSFTARDTIKNLYNNCQTGIILPDVTILRDGHSEGFRQVAPWKIDVLLVKGNDFEPYVVKV